MGTNPLNPRKEPELVVRNLNNLLPRLIVVEPPASSKEHGQSSLWGSLWQRTAWLCSRNHQRKELPDAPDGTNTD
jgi:hypothetical protein